MFCVSQRNLCICVWRLKQEASDKDCLKHSVKFATSIMVMGPHDSIKGQVDCRLFPQTSIQKCMKKSLNTSWYLHLRLYVITIKWLQEKEILYVLPRPSNLLDPEFMGNYEKTASRNCIKRQKSFFSNLKNKWVKFDFLKKVNF